SRRADRQMMESWADTAALLYSPGFITPNKVNIVYKTGPGVTAVAAYSGGQIVVNSAWARAQPSDTGLTVHEVSHSIQAMSAYNPVWLIEGISDYIRWVKFEPQNHKPRLDPDKAKYSDSYRTTGTFVAWVEMKYDPRLATKLNHEIRFGKYKPELWKQY
ncbi:basic secretory protein-like protein, partial [Ralstonia sp. VS2407]